MFSCDVCSDIILPNVGLFYYWQLLERYYMPTFWFIRHAESESNAGLKTTSPKSINITEKGKQQAQCIADFIADKPNLFIHSPYVRTEQTGQPLFEKFPDVPIKVWPIQEFTYLQHEDYNQTTTRQRYPKAQEYFRKGDPDYVSGEGAESFNQFRSRIKTTLDKMRDLESDFTVIFGHGWFMRAALWERLIKDDLTKAERIEEIKFLKEKLMIGHIPFTLYSLFGLRPPKKIMNNFLFFSSITKIPNGTIFKFEVDNEKEIHFIDSTFNHIPEELRGSSWVDR
jgi:broad specificity phosphatase PhoE